MFFTPERLMIAGIHKPTSTSRTVSSLLWPLLMNTSTYSTQPTAIPALPAHAVIQYDHALKKPTTLPNAAREYAYGPPSAGSRRDRAANISASAMAPIVVSPIETSVIGPIPASDVGRLKIPTPMMLPMISAIATGSPKPPPAAAPGPVPSGWDCATAAPDGGLEPGSPVRSDGVSAMAHSLSVIDGDSFFLLVTSRMVTTSPDTKVCQRETRCRRKEIDDRRRPGRAA